MLKSGFPCPFRRRFLDRGPEWARGVFSPSLLLGSPTIDLRSLENTASLRGHLPQTSPPSVSEPSECLSFTPDGPCPAKFGCYSQVFSSVLQEGSLCGVFLRLLNLPVPSDLLTAHPWPPMVFLLHLHIEARGAIFQPHQL